MAEGYFERQDGLVALHVVRRLFHDLQEAPGALGIAGFDLARAQVGVNPQ